MNENVRTAKVFQNEQWEDIDPINLKSGMVFKMFEPNGSPVFNSATGLDILIATGNPYLNDEGIVTIQISANQ